MKLFQYWNTKTPPDDVASWLEGFRTGNPDLEHILFDEESAGRFIEEYYGTRALAAFKAVSVPSMQSDYLRLSLLHAIGGFYSDADHKLVQPLSTLISENPGPMIVEWDGILLMDPLLFPSPGNLFVKACLDLCSDNVESRRFGSAYYATGPGVMNAVAGIIDPSHLVKIAPLQGNEIFDELVDVARRTIGKPSAALEADYRAIRIRSTDYVRPWFPYNEMPEYKVTGDTHWDTWQGPIYRD